MARTLGSTILNREVRRQKVLEYFLRGFKTGEIAGFLHCSDRTIQEDLAFLKPQLYATVQAERLHTLRISFLQKMEILKEAWILFHRPLERITMPNGQVNTRDSPGSLRKLGALKLALGVCAELDRVAGVGQQKPIAVTVTQQATLDVCFKEAIGRLPPDEQEVLAKAVRDIERSASQPH
jgi:hypothetical protein